MFLVVVNILYVERSTWWTGSWAWLPTPNTRHENIEWRREAESRGNRTVFNLPVSPKTFSPSSSLLESDCHHGKEELCREIMTTNNMGSFTKIIALSFSSFLFFTSNNLNVVDSFSSVSRHHHKLSFFHSHTAQSKSNKNLQQLVTDERKTTASFLSSTANNDDSTVDSSELPQVFATGYSSNPDLLEAITIAVKNALQNLPPPLENHPDPENDKIDLALITISSLYDNQSVPMSTVVPTLLTTAENEYGLIGGQGEIRNVIGCTAAGIVSWDSGLINYVQGADGNNEATLGLPPKVIESEGIPGVSVTLAKLPDVELKLFHVEDEDVPDDVQNVEDDVWKRAVGLSGWDSEDSEGFFLLPSPSFQKSMNDLVQGFEKSYESSVIFGGMASTVSSLSRARLFYYSSESSANSDPTVLNQGCLGLGMKGDIKIDTLMAQGAKPVGNVYKVVQGEESTIQIIMADETSSATDSMEEDPKAFMPKPVLAEANRIMKNRLTDDEASFMKRTILIGLEQDPYFIPGLPSSQEEQDQQKLDELERLAEGGGHAYNVKQVASAGMKDGSVTFQLGSVDIERGRRMRFFVREPEWCKNEISAILTGYYRKKLSDGFNSDEDSTESTPSGCFMLSTMDRGNKFFGSAGTNKSSQGNSVAYEGDTLKSYLTGINSVCGFYGNGKYRVFH